MSSSVSNKPFLKLSPEVLKEAEKLQQQIDKRMRNAQNVLKKYSDKVKGGRTKRARRTRYKKRNTRKN